MAKFQLSAKNIAYLGVLLALVIVLQSFGGTIAIGAVQLNFTLIPIVLGAILFGAAGGALLGFACGVVVLIQVILCLSPFYTVIWTYDPVVTVFTCILKTTAAGAVAGWLYGLISKKNRLAAVFVAAGIVPIINTGLFIVGCLLMGRAIGVFQGELDMGDMNPFVFIVVVLVTWNFFLEFAVNLVVAPAIHRVVAVAERLIGKRKKKGTTAGTEPEAQPPLAENTEEKS